MVNFMLNPIVLPQGSALRRRHIVPAQYRLEGYDETYDFRTIAYDVIWIERQKALLLICPKLLNLEGLVKAARITACGQVLPRPRIKRYRRHDEVWIPLAEYPSEISFEADGLTLQVKISRQSHEFDGKNVMMTKSKDNTLVWIQDWLRHHVSAQGANAALIFDNGSTQYPLSHLQQAMENVPGLEAAHAIASDFPFGSWKASKLMHRSMFYQAGMLAIARHRFLHAARAVLPIDVDEMVTGANVFDAALRSRLGYVTIPGVWRYSKLTDDQTPLHADHVWRRDPDAACKEKYCVIPGRWFTDTVWDIHGLRRYAFNRMVLRDDVRFLHCEHISNGWKRKRDAAAGALLMRDAQSEAAIGGLR